MHSFVFWSFLQMLLLYLPTQIRFLIGGDRVTCHWSKLHDALGRTKLHDALGQQQLELSTHTWSGRAPLKRRQICTPADVKQIIFICVLFYFELGGITKHLMTGPSGNSEFCFPSTSMFPSASPRGTLRVSGKQNSLFPLGPVIKCLFINYLWKMRGYPQFSFWISVTLVKIYIPCITTHQGKKYLYLAGTVLKQRQRRRQQERHIFAYLVGKNTLCTWVSTLVHFFAVVSKTTTWNSQLWGVIKNVSTLR